MLGKKNKYTGEGLMASIKSRFAVLFTTLALTAFMGGTGVYYVLQMQKYDTAVINIAGRQRTLSQKMAKEAISLAYVLDDKMSIGGARKKLENTSALFEKSLKALLNGGITTIARHEVAENYAQFNDHHDAEGERQVNPEKTGHSQSQDHHGAEREGQVNLGAAGHSQPRSRNDNHKDIAITLPASEGKGRVKLEEVALLWESFKKHVDKLLDPDEDIMSVDSSVAFSAIYEESEELLHASDDVVNILHHQSEKKMKLLRVSLVVGVLLVFLFCILGWYLSQKIALGIQRVADAITRISEDDLSEQEISFEYKGEVGQLARAYDQLGKNLRGLLGQANMIAEGDLSLECVGDGDLASAFRKMVDNLSTLINEVRGCGMDLQLTSSSILQASNDQSLGSSQQSASISETTATMEELSRTSTQIAQRGENVIKMAGQTLVSVEKGKELTGEVIAGMYKINESSEESAKKVLELVEKSQKIGDVIDIINGFAEQTNLLALNASIEAARVGEVGKGFAVVAHEVRNLAENVAESAQEIKDLILEIQSSTNASVMAIDEGTKRVRSGVNSVEEASASFGEILNAAKKTTNLAKEIGVASQQQKVASEQVTVAMKEINGVALDFAANTKQTSSSAGQLNQVAEKLTESMARFKLGEKSEDEQTSPVKVVGNSSNDWKRVDSFEFGNTSKNKEGSIPHTREESEEDLSGD